MLMKSFFFLGLKARRRTNNFGIIRRPWRFHVSYHILAEHFLSLSLFFPEVELARTLSKKTKKEHGISTSVFYPSIKITTIVCTTREAPSSPHLCSFNYRFLYPTKLFSFSETVSKYYFQSTSAHTFQRSRCWNLSFR